MRRGRIQTWTTGSLGTHRDDGPAHARTCVRRAALLALVLLAAGCRDDNAGDAAGGDGSSQRTTQAAGVDGPTPEGIENAVRALRTAARAVPNGKPFDLEQERRGGQRVWEVKVASDEAQFTVVVSFDGSSAISRRRDATPDDDVVRLRSARIGAARAATIAAQQGGRMDEMELDTTDAGVVVWQVDLIREDGSEVEISLDARTGEPVGGED